jgi:uncharacterized membrane protein YfcA
MPPLQKTTFTMQTIIILVIIGLAAGIMGGMVGVGGGIIIVPALVYFLAFSQHEAQGTSLGLIVLPVALFGGYQLLQKRLCRSSGCSIPGNRVCSGKLPR